jgi:flagellin-specific chaperone FliS
LVVFGEERQQEIRWLFDALNNSLEIAERNADVQRSSSAASSLRHAKNLLSFLNRCFADLPDKQLVNHLDDFFAMLDRAIDQSIQMPLVDDLEEIRELITERLGNAANAIYHCTGRRKSGPPDEHSVRLVLVNRLVYIDNR